MPTSQSFFRLLFNPSPHDGGETGTNLQVLKNFGTNLQVWSWMCFFFIFLPFRRPYEGAHFGVLRSRYLPDWCVAKGCHMSEYTIRLIFRDGFAQFTVWSQCKGQRCKAVEEGGWAPGPRVGLHWAQGGGHGGLEVLYMLGRGGSNMWMLVLPQVPEMGKVLVDSTLFQPLVCFHAAYSLTHGLLSAAIFIDQISATKWSYCTRLRESSVCCSTFYRAFCRATLPSVMPPGRTILHVLLPPLPNIYSTSRPPRAPPYAHLTPTRGPGAHPPSSTALHLWPLH
jgi:hypothetical protein